MHQERTGRKSESAGVDFVILIALVLAFVFARRIFDFFATFRAPWDAIAKAFLFLLICGACYYYYRARLCDFRYSIIYRQIKPGELNIFGEDKPYPWEEGTVLFERTTGKKGKFLLAVKPAQLEALLEPGEAFGEKISFLNTERYSELLARRSHTLVYRENGKLGAVRFSPTEQMVGLIREAIAAKAAQ